MESKTFNATLEYVPLLIGQMTSLKSDAGITINFFGISHKLQSEIPDDQKKNLMRAMEKLREIGQKALFPLLAALNDEDPQVADAAAEVLGKIYDQRAVIPLLNQLEIKAARGDELYNSPFYTALQKLGYTATDGVMTKVRPNKSYAKLLFTQTYPGTEVKRVQSADRPPVDPASPSVFKVHYTQNGQEQNLILKFQRTVHGDWIPRPPLPDTLFRQ